MLAGAHTSRSDHPRACRTARRRSGPVNAGADLVVMRTASRVMARRSNDMTTVSCPMLTCGLR
jgi:hypothetical protein